LDGPTTIHSKRVKPAPFRSRSQQRRIAAQKGEPAPEFDDDNYTPDPPPLALRHVPEMPTEDSSAEDLDAWFDNVMKGVKA
jgi:hypothetical protein